MAGVISRLLSIAGIYTDADGSNNPNNGEYVDDRYESDDDYPDEEPEIDDRPLNDRFRYDNSGRRTGVTAGGVNRQLGARGNLNNVVNMPTPVQKPQNYVLVSSKPDRLEDAQLVCEHLKERHVVIVNVESLDSREAQRIVDFIGGAVIALDGEIIDVSKRIFAVAPNNVDLVAIRKDPKSRGFLSFGGN